MGSKHRLEAELEEMALEYERTHAAAVITEKRGKNFEKVVGEWKAKADDLVAELEASQSECRNMNAEQFRLKAGLDETTEQLDIVKRENKNLADEIKDLLDQLGDGGRSIHELDKQRRRLEVEKEELFDNTRKNHQRAMDSLGASLEAEQRAKSEALRIKKKLESDINELEIALDHANKANSEGQKAIKRYQGTLRDTIQGYEDEACARQQVMEQVGISERKANALSGEVEESRALLDSAERAKRQLDSELAD